MDVGYNYAWPSHDFGQWLGPYDNQKRWPTDYAQRYKDLRFAESIEKNLQTLKDNGVSVVRWQLLGNGLNYGLPPTEQVIRRTGLHAQEAPDLNSGVFSFTPPAALDPLFIRHFSQLMAIHARVKMKMILSLLSFEFFATDKARYSKSGGRADIAQDGQKRNTFLFTVLGEFLKASEPQKDLIYAWEVINEPAWDIRNITPKNTGYVPHAQWVGDDAMTTFLRLALAWIEGHKFPSTVGHRFLSDLSLMPTGTLPQFHYYATVVGSAADPPKLPQARDAKNAFIGEFGSLIGEGYEIHEMPKKGSSGNPWRNDLPDGRDLNPGTVVFDRLARLKDLGYSLALVWPDLDDDDVDKTDGLKLSAQKLSQIKRFVGKT